MSLNLSVDTTTLHNIDECPSCKRIGDIRCIDSRMNATGNVRLRRKVCACGNRWSTVELLYRDLDKLINSSPAVHDLYELESFEQEFDFMEKKVSELKGALSKARRKGLALSGYSSDNKPKALSTLSAVNKIMDN